jgi:hypothetical protein
MNARIAAAAAAALTGVLALAAPARSELPPADPAIVPLFEEICLKGELTAAGREAALAAGGWEPVPADTLKPKWIEVNPLNIDFAKPETVRQWKRNVGGREVRAMIAGYREKAPHRTACALLVPDTKISWPYWDGLEAVLKPLGIKAKETDLPHYRAYGGRLPDGRKARATISSRSAVDPEAKKLMHIAIGY